MAEFMGELRRTAFCGEITDKLGQEVVVMGWTAKRRDLGGLIFADIRDKTGICQAVFDNASFADFAKAERIRSEYVLAVRGVVRARSEETVNPKLPTGTVEILVSELKILSEAETPPFAIEEDSDVNELIRLKYRYLDLRRPDLQRRLFLRHRITSAARHYLEENGFTEIETPFLGKSTPEGARDYLVPSRVHPGQFYALPQSPQLYKQLLMIAGMDRYYQIRRHDGDGGADRADLFGGRRHRAAPPLPPDDLPGGHGPLRVGQAGHPLRAGAVQCVRSGRTERLPGVRRGRQKRGERALHQRQGL